MEIMLFAICIIQTAFIAFIQIRFEKEREGYVKMIAAKNYPEFQSFEAPVKNTNHSNMFKKQQP